MAMCERCLGTGVDVGPDHERGCFGRIPCHECQGSGIVSCCDTAGSANQEIDELKDQVRRLETSLEYAGRMSKYLRYRDEGFPAPAEQLARWPEA